MENIASYRTFQELIKLTYRYLIDNKKKSDHREVLVVWKEMTRFQLLLTILHPLRSSTEWLWACAMLTLVLWDNPWTIPEPLATLQRFGIVYLFWDHISYLGLPWWHRQHRICLQWGKPGFSPWVGKIPWRRERLPTPVFVPGEPYGHRSLLGYSPRVTKSWTWQSD